MKPRLYATSREDWVSDAAARILPRRCPLCSPYAESHGVGWTMQTKAIIWKNGKLDGAYGEMTVGCPRCGGDWGTTNGGTPGRGWLYPDPPDWWMDLWLAPHWAYDRQKFWERHCRDTWRAMGILEESD